MGRTPTIDVVTDLVATVQALKPGPLTAEELRAITGFSQGRLHRVLRHAKETGAAKILSRKIDDQRRYVLAPLTPPPKPKRDRFGRRPIDIELAEERWQRFRAGEAPAKIAAAEGMTREGVRLSIVRHVGEERYRAEVQRQKEQRRAEAVVRRQAKLDARQVYGECYICGGAVYHKKRPRDSVLICSEAWCTQAWVRLRFHSSPERRARQQRYIALGILKNPDSNERQIRHAKRVIAGEELEFHGRWLTKNSSVWPYALEALRRDLPIFHMLPLEVQQQVRERALADS